VEEFLRPHFAEFSATFIPARLDESSARFAAGHDVVCNFVNDECDAGILEALSGMGVRMVANRCAGYDRVDLKAAQELGIAVARVPTYSPESVAEAGLCLMLATARNLRLSCLKVAVGNYTLDGLVGTQLSGKTFGVIGTGAIGTAMVKLLTGFGGKILAYDLFPSEKVREAGAEYVEMDRLLAESDVITLHTPLLPSTKHIICRDSLAKMKHNSILVNVSRGGLIDTESLVEMLVDGSCGVRAVGMDVYEDEESLFFTDFTDQSARQRMKRWDAKFQMLKNLPQVVVTPHTAFLTEEALNAIGETTRRNIMQVMNGLDCPNCLH
jgi:D-lactate dehydrogenase